MNAGDSESTEVTVVCGFAVVPTSETLDGASVTGDASADEGATVSSEVEAGGSENVDVSGSSEMVGKSSILEVGVPASRSEVLGASVGLSVGKVSSALVVGDPPASASDVVVGPASSGVSDWESVTGVSGDAMGVVAGVSDESFAAEFCRGAGPWRRTTIKPD